MGRQHVTSSRETGILSPFPRRERKGRSESQLTFPGANSSVEATLAFVQICPNPSFSPVRCGIKFQLLTVALVDASHYSFQPSGHPAVLPGGLHLLSAQLETLDSGSQVLPGAVQTPPQRGPSCHAHPVTPTAPRDSLSPSPIFL